ncbi:ABC transporter substrate-binding protein [Nocardia sp. NPDC019395]|uniref:ABC transporter substrate-binding protein n=1 Tax=Nocardia sp. NPDC019395 TaxID=3154686 RepID=UPI00340DFD05
MSLLSHSRFAAWLRAVVGLFVAVVAVAGCSSSAEPTAESGTRPIQTQKGTVEVPANPQRVVVLNGALGGYLYDLGVPVAAADTRVLGVTDRSGKFPPTWSEDATKQGTQVVPIGQSVNVEFVASMQPDLIIGGGQGFPAKQSVDAYDQLSAIAPTVLIPGDVTGWQDQLKLLADVVGKGDKAGELITAYEDRLQQVKDQIKAPEQQIGFFQSAADNQPKMILPNAALPTLLAELGFKADDKVVAKAGNPDINASADWFNFSPELLTKVVDQPVVMVVPLSGAKSAADLAKDPMFAQLPAFKAKKVYELPATSYRPDYRGVMSTLDVISEQFK